MLVKELELEEISDIAVYACSDEATRVNEAIYYYYQGLDEMVMMHNDLLNGWCRIASTAFKLLHSVNLKAWLTQTRTTPLTFLEYIKNESTVLDHLHAFELDGYYYFKEKKT